MDIDDKEILEELQKNGELSNQEELSLAEFIERLSKDPNLARSAHQYLLDAIKYYGKREVFESGEKKKRYNFFDDPNNNGKYAILGNTDLLNQFVRDLEVVTKHKDKFNIFHVYGPTATGKSEFKKCIIEGLKAYSKTDEGARYTIKVNNQSTKQPTDERGLSYIDTAKSDNTSSQWYESPVQSNPISLLPKDTRKKLQEQSDKQLINTDIDPFINSIIEDLQENHNLNFEQVTDQSNMKVKRYYADEGKSIGTFGPDNVNVKVSDLTGSWIKSMLQNLDSLGERDPRAFSYDGLFSQGNTGISILEDVQKREIKTYYKYLLNFTEEKQLSLDNQTKLDIDTVPIFITNDKPSFEESSFRRARYYHMKRLTKLTYEYILLRKELTNKKEPVFSGQYYDITNSLTINQTELAPHALEAVALLNVVTRLFIYYKQKYSSIEEVEGEDLIRIAMLLDRGHTTDYGGERVDIEEYDLNDKVIEKSGVFGYPVTVAKHVISNMLYNSDKNVFLPQDIIEKITQQQNNSKKFYLAPRATSGNTSKRQIRKIYAEIVKDYIIEKQTEDVINAILHDRTPTEESVQEYINEIYSWSEGEQYDEYLVQDFEDRYLGWSKEKDIETLRKNKIIAPLNRYLWNNRQNHEDISDIDLSEIPVLVSILEDYTWDDVFKEHTNLDAVQWKSPPKDTETYEIKQKTIEQLAENYNYTEKSAKLTSELVFENYTEQN